MNNGMEKLQEQIEICMSVGDQIGGQLRKVSPEMLLSLFCIVIDDYCTANDIHGDKRLAIFDKLAETLTSVARQVAEELGEDYTLC